MRQIDIKAKRKRKKPQNKAFSDINIKADKQIQIYKDGFAFFMRFLQFSILTNLFNIYII